MKLPRSLFLVSLATLFAGPANALTEGDLHRSMTPTELRVDGLRDQEIKQLQLVISRSAPREQQPDLLLRLSELYTEKYKLFFFKESDVWSKKMDEFLAMPPAQQKIRAKPLLDSSGSKQWLTKAVDVLEQIPVQKIAYSRIDEVYYFLAFNQWELGRKNEAVKSFEKIINSYPKSRFISEAYRYAGDFAFAARDFEKAKQHYENSAKAVNSPARPRILYGLGWTYFKMQDYKRAVSTMKEAIQLGHDNSEAAKAGLALQRDAAESLALFFSEGGNVDEAAPFFTDLFGQAEGAQVMRRLSEFYQRQGKYAKALAVNKQLLSMGGAAAKQGEEQRFEIMVASLNVATSKGDHERKVALLKSMTAEFVTNAKDPEEEKVEILRSQVRKAATLAHREGNKSNHPKQAHQDAEDLYRLYLSAFSKKIKEDDAAEIHWYLSDVLTQLGKHKEAVDELRLIIDKSESEPAYAKYKKEASEAMVYSMDNYFKDKGDSKKLSKNDSDQVIASIDSFVKAYPKDKKASNKLARAAGILVTSGRMDEARPRLQQIVEKYPSSKEAWDAAANLLRDAEERKDYAGAEQLAKNFLGNSALMAQDKSGNFQHKLDTISSRAKFQQVHQVEEKQDFASAAKGYERLAAESKEKDLRLKSLNNAAVSYGKAGDHANELRIYEQLLATTPANEQAAKSMLAIGNEHFLAGRYAETAEAYERFYRIYKNRLSGASPVIQKDALESLRSAALLRRALRQGEKANEDFRDIVEAANKGLGAAREAASEFLFDIARRLRDEGASAEAAKSFQKYNSAFPDGPHAVGALLETAVLYVKLKEEEKAQNYFRATISKAKAKGPQATSEENGYAARARLELLGPLEEAYENSPLRLPEKQLQADINAKLQALDRLNKGYIEVIDFGDGHWGVEAYRRLALAYRNYAQKIERAPIPEKYSPEDKAKFKAGLKNLTQLPYLKVVETLDTALQRGEQLQVIDATMAKVYILASINSAKPDRLPLLQFPDWSKPADWLMGELVSSGDALEKHRNSLRAKADELASWVAIGNYHMLRGETGLAEIFYLRALQKNSKYGPAINNLGFIRGREGDLPKAMSGFKAALGFDEFALLPKKNLTRLQMGAGMWRHASLNYRQLEVRAPADKEVKRGILLSALAGGKMAQVDAGASLLGELGGDNGKFVEAVSALGKGNRAKAAEVFKELSQRNEYARLILEFWNTKEGN